MPQTSPPPITPISIAFTVNGEPKTATVWPMARLLDVLRQDLALTGTKEGCGEGECGACAVFVDGEMVNACLVPVAQVVGKSVVTIEGLAAAEPRFPALADAFVNLNAAQCGICTPGMIVAVVALLRGNPAPTDAEIREALAGNLCRCTGYMKIFQAVAEAVKSGDSA